MKKILFLVSLFFLLCQNLNAQYNSEFATAWWYDTEDGLNRWFTGLDSTSSTLTLSSGISGSPILNIVTNNNTEINFTGSEFANIYATEGIFIRAGANYDLRLGANNVNSQLIIGDTEGFIYNDAGANLPFRIESDTKPDAFSLDGATGIISYDSLGIPREASWIADDDSILITAGMAGWGTVMIGDNQEFSDFRFGTTGSVTLIGNTTNVTNTDTDGNLVIWNNGTQTSIKNRLGSGLVIAIDVDIFTP
jgi:hypothetical protein